MPSCPQRMAKQLKAGMEQEPSVWRGVTPPHTPYKGTVSWGREQGLEIRTEPGSCVCSLRKKNGVAHPQPSVLISHFLSCGCSHEQGGRKEELWRRRRP